MSTQPQLRKHLEAYTVAARHLELNQSVIDTLERLNSKAADRCIAILKRDQSGWVTRLDKAAAKLGAPYPSPFPQDEDEP
jgi:hypothetical protein